MDRFVLAPLAGYSDKAFRQLAREHSADIAVTEMVSAEGLARDSRKTEALLERGDGEDRLIIQIFAPSADPVRRAMERLLDFRPTGIDINCGCPVPKVVKTGAGSALMKDPERMAEMVRAITECTDIPVSVKFRLGWDSSSINYMEFAEKAIEAGASALTLHARTRAQGYSGYADWEAFRNLSEHFKGEALLYGSGDMLTPDDAIKALDYGLDGIMFARGAIGNPFIFRQARDLMEKGTYELPTPREKAETAIRHLDLMIRYFGEDLAAREMRKHMMSYLKGIEGSSRIKSSITKASCRDQYIEALAPLLL